jgi:hypothetical protein
MAPSVSKSDTLRRRCIAVLTLAKTEKNRPKIFGGGTNKMGPKKQDIIFYPPPRSPPPPSPRAPLLPPRRGVGAGAGKSRGRPGGSGDPPWAFFPGVAGRTPRNLGCMAFCPSTSAGRVVNSLLYMYYPKAYFHRPSQSGVSLLGQQGAQKKGTPLVTSHSKFVWWPKTQSWSKRWECTRSRIQGTHCYTYKETILDEVAFF